MVKVKVKLVMTKQIMMVLVKMMTTLVVIEPWLDWSELDDAFDDDFDMMTMMVVISMMILMWFWCDGDFDMMMIESGSVLIRLERPVKQEGTQTLGHSDVWHLKSSSQIITIVSSLLSKLLNAIAWI